MQKEGVEVGEAVQEVGVGQEDRHPFPHRLQEVQVVLVFTPDTI